MNFVDFLIVIALTIFVAQGSRRGMIEEVLGLTGWIMAVLLAVRFMGKVGDILSNFARGKLPETVLIIMGFFVVLIVVRLAFQAAMGAFQRVFSQDAITKVNKIGGAVFGFFKGALFVSVIVLAISMMPLWPKLQQAEEGSMLFYHMQRFAPAVFSIVKKFIPQSQEALDKLLDNLEKVGDKAAEAAGNESELTENASQPINNIESHAKKVILEDKKASSDRKQPQSNRLER